MGRASVKASVGAFGSKGDAKPRFVASSPSRSPVKVSTLVHFVVQNVLVGIVSLAWPSCVVMSF